MDHKKAEDLLKQAGSGKLDANEEATIDTWYIATAKEQEAIVTDNLEKKLDRIWKNLPVNREIRGRKIKLYSSLSAAAAIIVVIMFFLTVKKPVKDPDVIPFVGKYKNDVRPGTQRAVLVRSDGTELDLENSREKAHNEHGIQLVLSKGQLSYNGEMPSRETEVFNVLKVPLGGEYQVKLSDGTRVWLNAGSSLRYPVAFSGKQRQVELTGEAYFEVAKDSERPFRVKSGPQEIEVLGTHFNVNAYADEEGISTSLLEGSVKVSVDGDTKQLRPGQQSRTIGDKIRVAQADVENAVAWKNGQFSFNGEDIASVMRELSRWYNLDIEYVGNVSQDTYKGRISKKVTLTQVLKILELSGTRFDIEGKKIRVYQ